MKKYITIGCVALGTMFGTTSCGDDFLTVDAPSSLLISDYYNSDARIFEALVAAYDPMNWFDYAWGQYTNLHLVSDVMSDDVYVGGSDNTDCEYLHRMSTFRALPTSVCSDLWTTLYSGINRSNIVLEYIDGVPGLSETTKQQYIAEAKGLRSFYYMWLWKLWGNVPYYEMNLEFPYIHEQNTADEVYEGIVTTLEDAIANGGLPMKQSTEWYGRISLSVLYMMYTEAVLYQNDTDRYSKALGYMKEIISSNQYSLVADYASIWEESGEWGSESIWEINYFSDKGKKDWGSAIADGGTVYPKLIGINGLVNCEDFDGGWGFEPVRAEAYAMFDENDNRRDASILNFAEYAKETGASYEPRYQDTGYFLRKCLPRKGGNANASASADMNYNNNVRLYRYAETLLNAAELSVLTGANGQTYLDQVRSRAGLSSVTATRDNILNERHLEFVGEGKRYWDLVRSGKAASVLAAGSTPYREIGWSESKKYLPIPQNDIDSAGGTLVQNEY